MANDYYNHGSTPVTGSAGSSAVMRAEFNSVTAGFALLPTLTGNGGKIVAINAGGTAQTVKSVTGTGDVVLATDPTFTGGASFGAGINVGSSGVAGSVTLGNATSGTVTLQPVTGALGTKTVLIPAANGTMAVSVSAPLALNATTGALSITGAAGQVLAGATPAFTATPTLGASGTIGTLTLGNATSGTITLQTVAGALGSVTLSFPAVTDTLAVKGANTFTGVQTMTSPAITTPAFTGAFSGTYSLGGTPTINVAAAVGGAWTAAATWTLPAHTLGGTVSGGGNNINNVVIGAVTPLAGSFTTVGASGIITASGYLGVGASTAPTANLPVHVRVDQNGATEIKAQNTTNNTAGEAKISAVSNGYTLSLRSLATNFTTSGLLIGDRSVLTSDSIAGLLIQQTHASGTIVFSAGGGTVAQMTLGTGGALGLGMTPSNVLDITQSTAGDAQIKILNSNAGTAATARLELANGTSVLDIIQFGASYTTSTIYRQNGSMIVSTGAGGLTLNTNGAQPMYFAVNSTMYGGISTGGLLHWSTGGPSGSTYNFFRNAVAKDAGNYSLVVGSTTASTVDAFLVQTIGGGGANGANTAVVIQKDGTTGRSINSAGTNNAAGADYAEYEYKRQDCGGISKGQIIGRDANGMLTDKWSCAVTFGIKTTNPSIVGGDVWGHPDIVGEPPRDKNDGETAEEFQKRKSIFFAALEVERAKVDRIAKCGRVPCNIKDGNPGDYVVPVEGQNDTIDAIVVPKNELSLVQYINACAYVRRSLDDGRREVEIKVG